MKATKRSAGKEIVTEVTPVQEAPWKVRHLAVMERKIGDLHAKLEEANRLMRIFRSENMALVGGRLFYLCSDVTGRAAVGGQWHGLVVRRDQLLREWNSALAEYAGLKTQEGQ